MIPLSRPWITDSDIASVAAILRSGALVQGREVAAMEAELAQLLSVNHAVMVSSGTAALIVSLAALGIGPGDRVAVPAYSWVATANVVELLGATPVFVDIDARHWCLDVGHLEHIMAEDSARSVRAILPVHVFGRVADMDEICRIGDRFQIPVVEDAACALGASLSGRPAGAIGTVGCFSFHPMKVVTTGEGGALVTDDPELAHFARAYRDHGQQRHEGGREFVMAGPNLRMTDTAAALGRSQLGRLPEFLSERRAAIARYHDLLSHLPVEFQTYDPPATTGQVFAVLLPEGCDRGRVVQSLGGAGITAGSGTVAIPFTSHYQARFGLADTDLPVVARIAPRILSLPLFNGLQESEQARVAAALETALREQGAL